jgi:hypothetical protein
LLLPLTCAACNVFSNQQLMEAAPAIAECESKAQKVGLPPISAGMDMRVIAARYRAALMAANKNLGDTSQCLALLDEYEKQGFH